MGEIKILYFFKGLAFSIVRGTIMKLFASHFANTPERYQIGLNSSLRLEVNGVYPQCFSHRFTILNEGLWDSLLLAADLSVDVAGRTVIRRSLPVVASLPVADKGLMKRPVTPVEVYLYIMLESLEVERVIKNVGSNKSVSVSSEVNLHIAYGKGKTLTKRFVESLQNFHVDLPSTPARKSRK